MKNDLDLQAFIHLARQVEFIGALWKLVQNFAKGHDIRSVSYHSVDVQSLGETVFGAVAFGIPAEFTRRYLTDQFYLDDPATALAARRNSPFYWSDIPKLAGLTKAQTNYLSVLKDYGMENGISMQVFGPQARNALVGIGFRPDRPRLSRMQIDELQWACQCAHVRFCTLTPGPKSPYVGLSPRELEVLRWIARGKSNAVIADIVGISRHTVDTITRRMFDKLGVTDRTTAAVRGIGSGLLNQTGDNLM